MKTKRPLLGDKVRVLGIETIVVGFDMLQPEAPHFFTITDSAGSDLRVEWREGVWAIPGTPIKVPSRPPPPKVPADFAKVRRRIINPLFQPAKPDGKYAEDIKLSPEIQALHDVLDEARDAHHRAVQSGDADAILSAMGPYARAIDAVNQADPGFYLGRRAPLAAAA
jgi:hypothetical protein